MNNLTLGRREFIRITASTVLLGLSGCSFSDSRPTLKLPRGVLPSEFLQALEKNKPWQYNFFHSDIDLAQDEFPLNKNDDLIALGDGWLKHCPFELFQPIEAPELYSYLSAQAIAFLNTFKSDISTKILPVAVSPWVLIFRGGKEFLARARDSWEVLLDPALRDQVVLPSSPRIIISLADQMKKSDSLRLLRLQAKAFDDKNGLNWLISGKAKVAVLPLQTCLNTLASDPRLNIALPKQGSPLNWTVLLRSKSSQEELPLAWIKDTWRLPLLLKLLGKGAIPPIDYPELAKVFDYLPKRYHAIYNSKESFQRSWSLAPLTTIQEKDLENRWRKSSP